MDQPHVAQGRGGARAVTIALGKLGASLEVAQPLLQRPRPDAVAAHVVSRDPLSQPIRERLRHPHALPAEWLPELQVAAARAVALPGRDQVAEQPFVLLALRPLHHRPPVPRPLRQLEVQPPRLGPLELLKENVLALRREFEQNEVHGFGERCGESAALSPERPRLQRLPGQWAGELARELEKELRVIGCLLKRPAHDVRQNVIDRPPGHPPQAHQHICPGRVSPDQPDGEPDRHRVPAGAHPDDRRVAPGQCDVKFLRVEPGEHRAKLRRQALHVDAASRSVQVPGDGQQCPRRARHRGEEVAQNRCFGELSLLREAVEVVEHQQCLLPVQLSRDGLQRLFPRTHRGRPQPLGHSADQLARVRHPAAQHGVGGGSAEPVGGRLHPRPHPHDPVELPRRAADGLQRKGGLPYTPHAVEDGHARPVQCLRDIDQLLPAPHEALRPARQSGTGPGRRAQPRTRLIPHRGRPPAPRHQRRVQRRQSVFRHVDRRGCPLPAIRPPGMRVLHRLSGARDRLNRAPAAGEGPEEGLREALRRTVADGQLHSHHHRHPRPYEHRRNGIDPRGL